MHDPLSPPYPPLDLVPPCESDDPPVEAGIEADLRALLDANTCPMFVYDVASLAFLSVNDLAVRFYGYPREQFLSMTVLDIGPPEEATARPACVSPSSTLFVENGSRRHRTRDGAVVGVEVVTHEVRWQGRAARSVRIADIAGRTRFFNEIPLRETRYRQMFENHPAMQLLIDPASGAIVDANPAACAFYGYPQDVLTAMNIRAINTLPPEEVNAAMRDAQTDVRGVFTFSHRLATGELRDVEVRSGPVVSDGRTLLFSIIHDVTERTAVDRALREREAHLADAQRITHLGSWEWDIASDLVSWSDETFRILGLVPGAVAPTRARFLAAIHPDDRAATAAAIQAALDGKSYAIELRIVRDDGTIRIVEATGEVERDARGRPIRLVGTLFDVTPRRHAQEQLHRYAYSDILTGLPNRHAFTVRLAKAAGRAKLQRNYRFAVLFLDLDQFKMVNDSLGHQRGDQLLSLVAARLQHCVGADVMVARFGGDEFAILLEGGDAQAEATDVAAQIHAALGVPFRVGGHQLRSTASVGIARGRSAARAEDLLRDADIAMYQAKARGRGRTVTFDRAMRLAVTRRLTLEGDMPRALERGEFRLVYQPVIALATGAVVGFEALVRWDHPRYGFLSPLEFVPFAEETGFILPLGTWVMNAACRQLQAWQVQHPALRSLSMSVNLSGPQITDPALMQHVRRILDETGIPPSALHLELTERILVEYTDAARATLTGLHSLGVRIDLDDFGVEYSSLNYLRRFAIDALKIDRSFVVACVENTDDRTMVRSIVDLARSLRIGVIAEGIENSGQLALLRELACEHGQGYYVARPMGEKDALAFMRDRAAQG